MLDWVTCAKTFKLVVDEGSFAAASRKLYTTPSAISKRVAWLEDELDAQLMQRNTRGLSLTESGKLLYDRSRFILNEWNELKNSISSHEKEPTGMLRIGMPVELGKQYVMQFIPEFLKKYPKVKIDLRLTNCHAGLHSEMLDLFVTYNENLLNSSEVKCEPLFNKVRKLYASPSYLTKHGRPKHVQDLAKHNCLLSACDVNPTVEWVFAGEAVKVDGNLKCNNFAALTSAAVEGVGILCLSPFAIRRELEAKKLVPVLPKYATDPMTFYAFQPNLRFTPKKTQLFIDYLKEAVADFS